MVQPYGMDDGKDYVPRQVIDRDLAKAKWRLHDILSAHVRADEHHLSDAEFVKEVVRRWARDNNHIISIGIAEFKPPP